MCYEKMAKHVCKAANRALGLVKAKCKVFGGFNFEYYGKLYDTMVLSVVNYGAAVWGKRQFSCINTIQLRAARYYMGVGKYTPNSAVQGDSGWKSIVVRQWSAVLNKWQRLKLMDNNRIYYKIFEWCGINTMLRDAGLIINDVSNYRVIKDQVAEFLFSRFKSEWSADINRMNARIENGRNKLRTYRQYKQEFKSETYLKCSMSRAHRSAYAKFRCGVTPIRIETGCYERLNYNDRTCFSCTDKIENEQHVLLTVQYISPSGSLYLLNYVSNFQI